MSQTIAGDLPKTKRKRAPKMDNEMGVERDLGRLEGTLEEHKARMDRTDVAHAEQFRMINERFDGIKHHLDSQDGKLDLLIAKSNREAGELRLRSRFISFGGWFFGIVALIAPAAIEVWLRASK